MAPFSDMPRPRAAPVRSIPPEPRLRARAGALRPHQRGRGVALTDEMRATLERFDREGLSAGTSPGDPQRSDEARRARAP